MKKLFFSIAILLGTLVQAQNDTLFPKSEISDVTVFFSGAEITRKAKVNLTKGQHLLWFDELPQQINPQSVQAKSLAGLQIVSVVHQLNYKAQGIKSKEEKAIEKKIEQHKVAMKATQNQIGVQDIEERLLLDNSKMNLNEKNLTVQELSALAAFYKERLNSIRQLKLDLLVKLQDQQDELEEHYKTLNKLLVKKRQTHSQILVMVECFQSQNYEVPISYFVSTAGWEPQYDFRVKDITKPLQVIYQANVFQTTGEDWKNVKLKLSSANPKLSGDLPELQRYYLGERETSYQREKFEGNAAITGRVFDGSSGDAVPFANVVVFDMSNKQVIGTTTDFDGLYTLKPIPPGRYTIQISYVGYQPNKQTIQLSADQQMIKDFSMSAGAELSAVVINYDKPLLQREHTSVSETITREEIERMAVRSVNDIGKTAGNGIFYRDRRSNGNLSYVDGIKLNNINLISNSLKNRATDLQYEIEKPFTVLSDGENYNLRMKQTEIAVDYQYYAIPKIEQSVFLTAQVPNWEQLNLLSGKVSIYYEGTFTSSTYLNIEEAEDTLNLSLGRDRGLSIKRTQDFSKYKKRNLSRKVEETVVWEISCRNQKSMPISIVIKDQYPLSKYESMKVELNETSDAKIDSDEGILSWELQIAPSESKTFHFEYTAEYPR